MDVGAVCLLSLGLASSFSTGSRQGASVAAAVEPRLRSIGPNPSFPTGGLCAGGEVSSKALEELKYKAGGV